jgi:hypothetical protein
VRLGKTILAVAGATVLLAALVSGASAGRLSTSSQQLKATFVRLDFTGGFGTIECEITVEGSFHQRTIVKTAGTLTGFITRAALRSPCRRGEATLLTETLPWHIQYSGFAGTLPSITSIRASIVGVAFRIREPSFGVTCLARSTAEAPGTATFNREAGGVLTSMTVGGAIPCSSFSGSFSGTSSSFDNGSGTRITVTLI